MSTGSVQSLKLGRDTSVRELLRPLRPYLAMDGVTEIVINEPGSLLFERGSAWVEATLPDLPLARLQSLARAIATYSDQDIGPTKPIMSAILPDGQRIQVMVPPVVPPDTISLSIRLQSQTLRSMDDYQREGAFGRFLWASSSADETHDQELASDDVELLRHLRRRNLGAFLTQAVRGRRNIAVVGDTGSGKTTLMKSLCQHIPNDERLITVEDVRELALPGRKNVVHLLYSKGGQGVAEVTPADLIAACMRMRPDRVLLAELRGSEAFDFLKLLTTGHNGSITSFHAESCALAMERYVLMAKEHGDAGIFDSEGLKRLVRLTIDVLVHIRAEVAPDVDGVAQKVRYISEVHYDPVAKRRDRFGDTVLWGAAS